MIRGTTAQFKFKLPYNFNTLIAAKFMAWQDHNEGPSPSRPLPIIKTLKQCSQGNSENELLVTLSKEETLRFEDDRKAYVQLFGKVIGAPAFGCKPRLVTVYPAGDDEIFDEDEIVPTPGLEDDVIILDGSVVT